MKAKELGTNTFHFHNTYANTAVPLSLERKNTRVNLGAESE